MCVECHLLVGMACIYRSARVRCVRMHVWHWQHLLSHADLLVSIRLAITAGMLAG
jgi:hypothetical protein